MIIPEEIPSIKTAGLISSFQAEENSSMVVGKMDEYALDYAEVSYENPREQEPMGLIASGK